MDTAKTLKGTECEGFVAHYPESGLRVKIKGDDYCKIHRICTKLSARKVWQILAWDESKNRVSSLPPEQAKIKLDEICAILPPEYSKWVIDMATKLVFSHAIMLNSAYLAAQAVSEPPMERKYAVARLQAEFPAVWHEALHIMDGQHDRASNSVLKRTEPEHEITKILDAILPILHNGEDE